ncbi:hypothetical protein RRG08_056308 [Elysia crispata]|uniref:Uncharacterized protein n=1 Tax=Elysia crispata TaxID=231223 RepID=A0AAE1BD94_9GAST|nr:hypothetical protein RRG08_056308 [Elysia crispata]
MRLAILTLKKNKQQHASLFHHSLLHMVKHNNVTSWLQTKISELTASLMSAARRSAMSLRSKHRCREQEVIKAVRRKLIENAAAQQELVMKAAASHKKFIDDVLGHVGPCRSPSHVKNLQSTLSGKELFIALKDEISTRKLFLASLGFSSCQKNQQRT